MRGKAGMLSAQKILCVHVWEGEYNIYARHCICTVGPHWKCGIWNL